MDTEEVFAEAVVAPAEPIKADVDVLEFVNLALVQNGLPALQDLRVTNETDEAMKDVVCAFSSDDGFIVPNQKAFKEIEAHGSVGAHNVDVLLNQRRVVEVRSEPAVGTVKMTVSVGGEVRCEKSYTMTILPVDQWLGVRPYAELLSAYVLPNADLVCRPQAEAAKEIEKMRSELCNIISNHTGQPFDKVFKDADRDFWMNAEEAVFYGMADDILKGRNQL